MSGFDPTVAMNSAMAALLAALGAVLLALPVAFAALTGRFRTHHGTGDLPGVQVQGIVMGTALVYLGLQVTVLYQTLFLLVMAYILRFHHRWRSARCVPRQRGWMPISCSQHACLVHPVSRRSAASAYH